MTARNTNRGLSATFAMNLRAARHDAGYTQAQLARVMGAGEMRISDWERGKHRPNDEHLVLLSRILDRPVHWFFADNETETIA